MKPRPLRQLADGARFGAAAADGGDDGQVAFHERDVDRGREREEAFAIELDAGVEERFGGAEEDDAGVDEFAAVDARDDAHDRVIK
jgi:hypothetical protein